MTADRLLAHFDGISDAPDAVPRLRRFILDLAVRGKLIPQDPQDQPASKLLSRIAMEKDCLVAAGKRQRRRSAELSQPCDLSFELPVGWAVAEFSDAIAELQTGPFGSSLHQHDYEFGGTPVINPASIQDGKIVPVSKMAVGKSTLQRLSRFRLEAGNVVMARRGEMGRCAVVTEQQNGWLCGTGSLIIRFNEGVNPMYVTTLIRSPMVLEYLDGSAVGTTMKNLNQSILLKMSVGLPPLAEQHRIVAKVDELTALCDELEAARAEREATRVRFAAACLGGLNAPDSDPTVVHAHLAFAIDNLHRLTTRPDQIKSIRDVVFNLAVRGKLVAQDPNDEPASELLKRIAVEKARLASAGEIRKRECEAILPPDEMPGLPANWAWSQVSAIGVISPRNSAPDDAQVSFVSMAMIDAEYGASHRREIRPWARVKNGYTHFAEGDVGLAKITPCFQNGKSTVFRNLTGGLGAGTTELHVVRPLFVDAKYVVLFFKCPHFIGGGIPRMTGTAGQKRVPLEYFRSAPFPLPPLAEQHRIVAKVDELMALCGRLEENIRCEEDAGRRALDAVLRETLATAVRAGMEEAAV